MKVNPYSVFAGLILRVLFTFQSYLKGLNKELPNSELVYSPRLTGLDS